MGLKLISKKYLVYQKWTYSFYMFLLDLETINTKMTWKHNDQQ